MEPPQVDWYYDNHHNAEISIYKTEDMDGWFGIEIDGDDWARIYVPIDAMDRLLTELRHYFES